MKKLLLTVMLALLFCMLSVVPTQADTESIRLVWEHDRPADLAGFRVYIDEIAITSCNETQNNMVADLEYTGQSELTTEYQITGSPEQIFYIRVTAYDEAGNESECSGQVTYALPPDTEPPNPPFNLIIEVVTVPTPP